MGRSLGTLTIDLLLKAGAFETDSGRAARIAEKNSKQIARAFDAAGKAIGVALVAGVTSVSTAVALAINRMDDMSKAAQRAQMPTEDFSKLAHAADLADVSMEDLTKSIGKLSKAQGDAAMGSKTQQAAFDALGIAYKNADGTLRNTTDVFADFADRFQKFEGSPEIMAAGMALFGRSFQNLIPLLKDGSAGLRAAFDDAEKLGLVLSTTAGQQAEQFNDNLSRMKSLVGGVAVAFASQLLPEMVQTTDAIVEMVKEAGGAAEVMHQLADGARVAWEVIKPLGVYVGTTYVSSMVAAAFQTGAVAKAMAAVAAQGGLLAATMNGLRVAAAFLFGPVGLIALGATGLYLLATRETEAEKAAKLHKQTLDEINGVMKVNAQQSAQLAAQKRNEALASLQAAQAVLVEAEARFKASEKNAYNTAGMGPGMGGASATSATMAAGRVVAARDMVIELRKEVDDLTKSVIAASVAASFQTIDQPTIPKPPKLSGDSGAAAKKAADEMARWRDEIEKTRAELQGPLSVAELEHRKRLDEIAAALKAGSINEAQANEARAQAGAQFAKQTAEIEKNIAAQKARADVMGRLKAEMQEEIRLSAMSADQRRVEETVLRARDDALKQSVAFNEDAARRMVAAADAQIRANEDHVRSLEDLQQAGVGAFRSMAQAMGDFVGRGFKGVKDMWSQIKDAFKRGVSDIVAIMLNAKFVQPLQNWLGQMLGLGTGTQGLSGFAQSQSGLGSILNNGFDRLLSGITSIFSRGGSAAQAMQTATEAGWQMAKAAGVAVVPAGQVGGMMLPGGQLLGGAGGSAFAGILGPLLGVGLGASMGGDTLGKIGGGLTGGALAYSMLMSGGGLAGLSAGMASGGLFGGLSGMAGAMGPIGWAALGAMALNSISGGKLFGTSYKTESASQQWGISEAGASGSQSVTSVKQQSFFRGRKWKTTTSSLDAEAMAAVNDLFATLSKTVQTAAMQLGIDVPDIVGGTFKREFDKNGKLTREFGTIAGRVYNEAQDAFAARLVGENLLAVAKAAGSSAELEQLANAYRGTGEELQSFATLALAVQEDLRSANGIWSQMDGDGVMTHIVEYVEGLAKAGESLADAYTRVQQTITQYGDLIGGVRTQIATRGLNQYQKAQLDIELAYRAQVKQANELAKALGLSGARAEDLTAIEQLRALNMADLAQQYAAQQQSQNQQWLADLGLSDLSPLLDSQKLTKGMDMLREAVGAGDAQRAQKLAEQVLGIGRNLYASGADYNALYDQVTSLVGDLNAASMEELQGLTNDQLANLADIVSGLPSQIAQELAALLVEPPAPTVPSEQPLPPAPTPVPPSSGGGGDVGGEPRCVAVHMVMDDGTLAGAAQAGDVHHCCDPEEGHTVQPVVHASAPVWRPCVRLVTRSGAALVCSASTPFTAVDAPADLPEYTTLAPEMLGQEVLVRRGGMVLVEPVVDVQDVGTHMVIPLDFGGRSFAAGEDADALVYSHNAQKDPGVGYAGPQAAPMSIMAPQMANSFDKLDATLVRIAEGVETQNKRLENLELKDLNDGSRVPGRGMHRRLGEVNY